MAGQRREQSFRSNWPSGPSSTEVDRTRVEQGYFEPLKENVFDQCCGGENEHDDDEHADQAGSQFSLSVFAAAARNSVWSCKKFRHMLGSL